MSGKEAGGAGASAVYLPEVHVFVDQTSYKALQTLFVLVPFSCRRASCWCHPQARPHRRAHREGQQVRGSIKAITEDEACCM